MKNRGIELVILLTPTRGLIHYDQISDEDRKKYNFTNLDKAWDSYWNSIDSIRNHGIHIVGVKRPEPDQSFFYKRDHHWNSAGAEISAKAVSEYVKNLPVYKDISKKEFITRDDGAYDFFGVSKKVFKKLCDTRQPPERVIKKLTTLAGAASNESDLFGDTKNPEIVLLGTSNSTMEPSFANFEGFLKQNLSADIINMSVSGGGLDTAFISYLNSDYFENSPAKIAIWEIPSYYDISNQNNFFREATAAANGNCTDKTNMIAQVKDLVIEDPSVLALDKLSSKNITGNDFYVNINFEKPISKPFQLDLRYVKNRDKYKFQRAGRYLADGKYSLSLRNDKKENLDKVVLTLPPEAKGNKVNVQICKKDSKLKEARLEPKASGYVYSVN